MKRLLGMAALAGAGVLAYRAMKNRKNKSQELQSGPSTQSVSNDQPNRWSRVDERSKESFPASDSPGTY